MGERPQQCETVAVSTVFVMRSRAFREGWEDARAGRPFRVDDFVIDSQWDYERGRLFAVSCPGIVAIKRDRRVRVVAELAFDDAWDEGSII